MMLRAMQACGALFIKTPVAQAFVKRTLDTSREIIIRDLVRYIFLLQIESYTSLEQTINRSQASGPRRNDADPAADDRTVSSRSTRKSIIKYIPWDARPGKTDFLGFLRKFIIVQMIRQSRLIQNNAAWEHQQFPVTDPAVLDAMWRDWARHECLKR
jgi:hypothetical protein